MRVLYLALLLLAPGIALAAPWCLVRDENEYCNYDTADSCYRVVSREGGSCRQNYREIGLRGGAPWCVVTSLYRRCIYYGKTSYLSVARSENGGCVRNVEKDLELAAKNKRQGASSDCEDISCELQQASRSAAPGTNQDQVVLEDF